ncbi:MAG TPA: ArsA-related P-loop ATPase [Actinomycetota bacterium]
MAILGPARVLMVSGKGGVGKSTVAAALAVAAAKRGERVLVADLEDRESVGPIFGLPKLPHQEHHIEAGITGLSVIPDEALVEYFRVVYRVPKFSRALLRSKAVEFATQTAPGIRDILLIGSIMQAERSRHDGRVQYDRIIVDAPPTGRLPRLLDAPRAIVELVRAGPIKPQAQRVLDLVLDPRRLQVVLVTLPEEMPVRETVEAVETLQKMDVTLGSIVVNGIWPALDSVGKNAKQKLRAPAEAAGLGAEALDALAAVASAHARRVANQRNTMTELSEQVTLPRIELPYLFTERIGRDEIDTLADLLEDR